VGIGASLIGRDMIDGYKQVHCIQEEQPSHSNTSTDQRHRRELNVNYMILKDVKVYLRPGHPNCSSLGLCNERNLLFGWGLRENHLYWTGQK
jgi:hypothetical protein